MDIIIWTLFALALASSVYWLFAWGAAWWFLRWSYQLQPTNDQQGVSILKPCKGLDAEAYNNFATFCRQDYEHYEILFGVADPDDPVVAVIRRLQADFPQCRIRLIMGPSTTLNPKSGMVHQLAAAATYDVLVLSDSDIRVTPAYLRRVTAPLADPHVGLVTCLYQSALPRSVWAQLESLHIDVTFLPSAIVGKMLPKAYYAFGASLSMRKSDLDKFGGFEAIGGYLADDYQLGKKISDLGLRVWLSDYVVSSALGATCMRDDWKREVRWARGIRTSCPGRFPGLLLTYSVPWALLLVILLPFSAFSWTFGWATLAAALAVRGGLSWWLLGQLGQKQARWRIALLPVRDVFNAAVWVAGAVGHTVAWRGTVFRLATDGRLEALDPARQQGVLKRTAAQIDAGLRDRQGIVTFTTDDDCLLRIAHGQAAAPHHFSDGTSIAAGEPILEIHFWNEHMPRFGPAGPDLAWALVARRKMEHTLRLLAEYLQATEDLHTVQACHGVVAFSSTHGTPALLRMVRHLGFELTELPQPVGIQRLGRLGEDIWSWILTWLYQPRALRQAPFRRERHEIWLTRRTLMSRYGQAPAEAPRPSSAGRQAKAWPGMNADTVRPRAARQASESQPSES